MTEAQENILGNIEGSLKDIEYKAGVFNNGSASEIENMATKALEHINEFQHNDKKYTTQLRHVQIEKNKYRDASEENEYAMGRDYHFIDQYITNLA